MKNSGKKGIILGFGLILAFIAWTIMVLRVDVQPLGQNGTNIGFAALNTRFHELTGYRQSFYKATEYLGYIPLLVCAAFGVFGAMQLIRGKSLKKVDPDILLLGVYYIVVIAFYLLFNKLHINYRPEGELEESYPSSHTLLVLSVMPTMVFQLRRRFPASMLRTAAIVLCIVFTAVVVIGRLLSGVHWLTDIVGGILLSLGLYLIYRSVVHILDQRIQ